MINSICWLIWLYEGIIKQVILAFTAKKKCHQPPPLQKMHYSESFSVWPNFFLLSLVLWSLLFIPSSLTLFLLIVPSFCFPLLTFLSLLSSIYSTKQFVVVNLPREAFLCGRVNTSVLWTTSGCTALDASAARTSLRGKWCLPWAKPTTPAASSAPPASKKLGMFKTILKVAQSCLNISETHVSRVRYYPILWLC